MLWINNQDENTLYLSVLTIGELQKGISKLPDSARKAELQAWVNNDLVARFQRRLLSIDAD